MPHITFLFSDTGGGHRSATEAIIEAIHHDYSADVTTEMIDFLTDHYPWPYRQFPAWYGDMVRFPRLYAAIWYATNGRQRTKSIIGTQRLHPTLRSQHNEMINNSQADLIVAMHWAAVNPLMWMPKESRPPVGVVVTDLVTVHSSWVHEHVDFVIVPTEAAQAKAIDNGIPPNRIYLTGLPVSQPFCRPQPTPVNHRATYGWAQDKPLVLLMGGGDGMGPLEENARAISASGLDVTLVIITGRNEPLRAALDQIDWQIPTHIYRFVDNVADFMMAADILVTKAGPSTLVEAMHCALPVILYSRIRGQEDGNVDWVVDAGAGQWSPTPELVIEALRHWVDDTAAHTAAKHACHQLATPHAAHTIAELLVRAANP